MNVSEQVADKYMQLNKLALKGEVAILGSTFMAGFDFGELIQRFGSNRKVYNRSVAGLKISQAKEIYAENIMPTAPLDIFICIGEVDFKEEGFKETRFIAEYETLIEYIRQTNPRCKIHVTSVVELSDEAEKLNARLEDMANRFGISYVNILSCLQLEIEGMEHFFVDEEKKPTIMGYIAMWDKISQVSEKSVWTIDDPWQKVGASNAISMCMEAAV